VIPRVLVATDGGCGALGALRFARQIEERKGGRVEVVAACEPTDYYRISSSADDVVPRFPNRAVQLMHRCVQSQIEAVGAADRGWAVDVEPGSFAATVLQVAVRRRSSHLVIGLPPAPDAAELWCGREAVQKVVQLSHIPVLTVPAGSTALPTRALVALDFSRFSFQAAWEVARLLGRGSELHLVHVLSEPLVEAESWDSRYEWADRYCSGVQRRLDGLAAAVKAVTPAAVRVHRLSGEPTHAILDLAEKLDVDLLALGSHGHGYLGRAAIGGTFSRLLRCTTSAMLIVPPTGIPAELARERSTAELLGVAPDLDAGDLMAVALSLGTGADVTPLRRLGHESDETDLEQEDTPARGEPSRMAAKPKSHASVSGRHLNGA
jgi:nucleotide-binding universal stress UspA family protein